MKISLERQKHTFLFKTNTSIGTPGVGQGGADITLEANDFRFFFPESIAMPHPDLIALTAVSVLYPWMKRSVEFPLSVSEHFAQALKKETGIIAKNIDKNLAPRERGGCHSISFSGGADSVGLSCLMPEETKKITFIRADHPTRPVREDNTKETVKAAVRQFSDAILIESDLEYIIGPYLGFPTWVALSAPCVLLADQYDLRSVAYGSIDGSSMVKNGEAYKYISDPDSMWNNLFSATGLGITKPVAGVSEIGTARICKHFGVDDLATSCTIGELGKPCQQCKKCFRKYLMNCAVNEEQPDNKVLNRFLLSKQVKDYITSEYPMYFQYIIMYAFTKFNTSKLPAVYKTLEKKLFLEKANME